MLSGAHGLNGTEGKKRDADVIVDAGYVRRITTGDIVVEDAMTFAPGPPREKARPKTPASPSVWRNELSGS